MKFNKLAFAAVFYSFYGVELIMAKTSSFSDGDKDVVVGVGAAAVKTTVSSSPPTSYISHLLGSYVFFSDLSSRSTIYQSSSSLLCCLRRNSQVKIVSSRQHHASLTSLHFKLQLMLTLQKAALRVTHRALFAHLVSGLLMAVP